MASGDAQRERTTDAPLAALTDAEAQLVADFRKLSPTWRDQVLRGVALMARLERDDAAPSARQDAPPPPASQIVQEATGQSSS